MGEALRLLEPGFAPAQGLDRFAVTGEINHRALENFRAARLLADQVDRLHSPQFGAILAPQADDGVVHRAPLAQFLHEPPAVALVEIEFG